MTSFLAFTKSYEKLSSSKLTTFSYHLLSLNTATEQGILSKTSFPKTKSLSLKVRSSKLATF